MPGHKHKHDKRRSTRSHIDSQYQHDGSAVSAGTETRWDAYGTSYAGHGTVDDTVTGGVTYGPVVYTKGQQQYGEDVSHLDDPYDGFPAHQYGDRTLPIQHEDSLSRQHQNADEGHKRKHHHRVRATERLPLPENPWQTVFSAASRDTLHETESERGESKASASDTINDVSTLPAVSSGAIWRYDDGGNDPTLIPCSQAYFAGHGQHALTGERGSGSVPGARARDTSPSSVSAAHLICDDFDPERKPSIETLKCAERYLVALARVTDALAEQLDTPRDGDGDSNTGPYDIDAESVVRSAEILWGLCTDNMPEDWSEPSRVQQDGDRVPLIQWEDLRSMSLLHGPEHALDVDRVWFGVNNLLTLSQEDDDDDDDDGETNDLAGLAGRLKHVLSILVGGDSDLDSRSVEEESRGVAPVYPSLEAQMARLQMGAKTRKSGRSGKTHTGRRARNEPSGASGSKKNRTLEGDTTVGAQKVQKQHDKTPRTGVNKQDEDKERHKCKDKGKGREQRSSGRLSFFRA